MPYYYSFLLACDIEVLSNAEVLETTYTELCAPNHQDGASMQANR